MSAFADTSFLFAFYFPRAASEQAMARVEFSQDAPLISSLVRYEFQQAVWLKVWLQTQERPLGLSEAAAHSALAAFDLDVEQGLWVVSSSEWESVVTRAERLALDHTPRHGARAMNILHVAFALRLGATELLTFDEDQRSAARAEGLAVSPWRSRARVWSSALPPKTPRLARLAKMVNWSAPSAGCPARAPGTTREDVCATRIRADPGGRRVGAVASRD